MARTWSEFENAIDQLDLTGRREAAWRASFETWSADAEARTLSAIATEATRRAHELEEATGANVTVSVNDASAYAVTLSIGGSRVDVYSVRTYAEAPCFHLGILRAPTSTRFPVLASLPGCLVLRGEADAAELVEFRRGNDAVPTSIEALVLRAFELLIGAHRSTRSAA